MLINTIHRALMYDVLSSQDSTGLDDDCGQVIDVAVRHGFALGRRQVHSILGLDEGAVDRFQSDTYLPAPTQKGLHKSQHGPFSFAEISAPSAAPITALIIVANTPCVTATTG